MASSASRQATLSPKARLERMEATAKKGLGQNFLVSQGAVRMMMAAAEVGPQDTVVEVGPGLGVLTQALVAAASKVVAVELDRELAAALGRELSSAANLAILCVDVREVNPRELTGGAPYKLVANLPYYAASPILRRFLESEHPPKQAVVMVQREVAKNMTAQPGQMSLMSVGVQVYGKPRIVGYVPPGAFYPRPKVTSAVVRIEVYPSPAVDLGDRSAFFEVVRAGFSAPRKQLRNALSHGLGVRPEEGGALLAAAGVDPRRRAETLTLDEWGALYRMARDSGLPGAVKEARDAGKGPSQD
ncbi:MAG: ribosomal RNA small subunit methyltransferase A [Chloroflexi bacterium]|nr:ribosomal RNA small subunit methyltransferase A [Chloroflexota bacterium]